MVNFTTPMFKFVPFLSNSINEIFAYFPLIEIGLNDVWNMYILTQLTKYLNSRMILWMCWWGKGYLFSKKKGDVGQPCFSLCYNKVIVACACGAIKLVTHGPKYVYMNYLSKSNVLLSIIDMFFGIIFLDLDYLLPFLSNLCFPAEFEGPLSFLQCMQSKSRYSNSLICIYRH